MPWGFGDFPTEEMKGRYKNQWSYLFFFCFDPARVEDEENMEQPDFLLSRKIFLLNFFCESINRKQR